MRLWWDGSGCGERAAKLFDTLHMSEPDATRKAEFWKWHLKPEIANFL